MRLMLLHHAMYSKENSDAFTIPQLQPSVQERSDKEFMFPLHLPPFFPISHLLSLLPLTPSTLV